jgi:hypothetical protein
VNNLKTRLESGSLKITVGGLSRHDLNAELSAQHVQLNAHAQILLEDDVFDDASTQQVITLVERRVSDLGLSGGGSLSQIFAAAQEHGLKLCPPSTGPYLRLAMTEQQVSTTDLVSRGRAPEGSFTVAARTISDSDEFPKGFYLRVVDGQPWLRGYRCDDMHMWSPDDWFIFQLNP